MGRQAIHEGPCWILAYVFGELHITDIGTLFLLRPNNAHVRVTTWILSKSAKIPFILPLHQRR